MDNYSLASTLICKAVLLIEGSHSSGITQRSLKTLPTVLDVLADFLPVFLT